MKIPFPKKPRPKGAKKQGVLAKNSQVLESVFLNPSEAPLEREDHPIQHGYVKSFDGTKLFYSVEGKGPPLVFCYGLVCSSLHWTYQIDYFRKNYRAIWVDYRGHHNSEMPSELGTLTLETIARDLGVVLDELQVEQAIFLGHSMGVNVVLEFYRQQPHRVAGMVLANGTAQRPLETLFRHNALQAGFHALKKVYAQAPEWVRFFWKLQKGNPFARSLVALGGFNPHLTAREDIERYVDQVAEMDPGLLIHLIENYDAYDANAWLHTVSVPTLILSGEQDQVIPIEQQQLMQQLIPKSRLEVIRHGSHCPQMDLPDLVNLKIQAFLSEIQKGNEAKSSPTKGISSQSNLQPSVLRG